MAGRGSFRPAILAYSGAPPPPHRWLSILKESRATPMTIPFCTLPCQTGAGRC